MTNTWFITGASSGFGRAFAEYALAHGHNVVATARRADLLAEIEATAPDRVLAIALDVTRPDQVTAGIEAATARFGRIDVLINNAGYGIVGAFEETPDAELRAMMETNFFGALTVTRAALPVMRAQRTGAIVMISSVGGQMSFAGFGPYSASKFALEGLTEALAQEIAPFGLKAMIVEPGAFRTSFAGKGGMRHMPQRAEYEEIVRGTRSFAEDMDGTQAGDPARAAAAIDLALKSDVTPLRLALGDDAVDGIRDHAEAVLAELTSWETVSRNVAFESAA
ncbi:oxidoreductase [Thalassococcus sp. S3]|uniref:oxidoreductase n=1 Tax=Thalassococcus sp. S3 TaxID=2017482 RepID=UPI00102447CB|nr:oxidoreductase [Thalassococcus sp. S3]QBF30861.1 short-chain dehydrogenase/reductase [Thalassococcus sp. S3]